MRWPCLFASLLLLAACGAKTDLTLPNRTPDPGRDAGVEMDASTEPDASVVEDAGSDASVDAFVPPDAFVPECPDRISVSAREASIPVDIIWVIDNSFSMVDEIELMRNNVNIFWDAIVDANVDSRVVFVTQDGSAPDAPIEFARRYFPVDYRVNSHDPLLALLANFDEYGRHLRPDAITHFVVVTDDDSLGLDWEDFHETMLDLLGHEYSFHSIASERVMPTRENPTGACFTDESSAYRPGREYYALSDETGGLKLSICNRDWTELFNLLTERVAIRIPIPCGYSLPLPPPPGIVYDDADFTVQYTVPGDDTPQIIPRVADEAACTGSEGWWFFEGSDRINLCESTCDEVDAIDGRVTVDLGCAVEP